LTIPLETIAIPFSRFITLTHIHQNGTKDRYRLRRCLLSLHMKRSNIIIDWPYADSLAVLVLHVRAHWPACTSREGVSVLILCFKARFEHVNIDLHLGALSALAVLPTFSSLAKLFLKMYFQRSGRFTTWRCSAKTTI